MGNFYEPWDLSKAYSSLILRVWSSKVEICPFGLCKSYLSYLSGLEKGVESIEINAEAQNSNGELLQALGPR